MATTSNAVFSEMLQRLYAALSSGPNLNCRPHNSRQRIDLSALATLNGTLPETILQQLLKERRAVVMTCPLPELPPKPKKNGAAEEDERAREAKLTPEQRTAVERNRVYTKLRVMAEDARVYEQDTGAHVLYLALPLLSIPPEAPKAGQTAGKRILAPLAFAPVNLAVTRTRQLRVELSLMGEGVDLLTPNDALLAWIRQQTGKSAGELFSDEDGEDPFRELQEVQDFVTQALSLPQAGALKPGDPLTAVPRSSDDTAATARIVPAAVLGLFPNFNQSLIDDTLALSEGEPAQGPLKSFVSLNARRESGPLEPQIKPLSDGTTQPEPDENREPERLVAEADPCQRRAVRLTGHTDILVVHGPPGTGKSQTITNMIGAHLARGERVLVVCDKRTAIDVVYNRLQHLGLGGLCAVVHAPDSDSIPLYKSVREQLDNLVDAPLDTQAERRLAEADAELAQLKRQLGEYTSTLHARPVEGALSVHELTGLWLEPLADGAPADVGALELTTPVHELSRHETALKELLDRASDAQLHRSPWWYPPAGSPQAAHKAVGAPLTLYLSKTVDEWGAVLQSVLESARATDAALQPGVAPFPNAGEAAAIGAARAALAGTLSRAWERVPPGMWSAWLKLDRAACAAAGQKLAGLATAVQAIRERPLDADLAAIHRSQPVRLSQLALWTGSLNEYLGIARSWYGFLCFNIKSLAAAVTTRFGLALSPENAERVLEFLNALKTRLSVVDAFNAAAPEKLPEAVDDETLVRVYEQAQELLAALAAMQQPKTADLSSALQRACGDEGLREAALAGLNAAAARGTALAQLEQRLSGCGLFHAEWLAQFRAKVRAGGSAEPELAKLTAAVRDLEPVLRTEHALDQLPADLRGAALRLIAAGVRAAAGVPALRQAVAGAELKARIKAAPFLFTQGADALDRAFARYRELEKQRAELTRAAVQALWLGRQKARLVAPSGTRVTPLATALRGRLMLRGRCAMRLRQVIQRGQEMDHGGGCDPLFDLRPVWMASPATVAQLFPRAPLFDLVLFDEASQCRLEEALPVLTRGKRVMIAGDPNQLPPTRFFESAVAQSDAGPDPEDDEALFTAQQAAIDDLLSSALELSVEQCHLDVHYRSTCEDLIAFSNRQFYGSRLQPIPGHPARRLPLPPVRLEHVGGTFEESQNEAEAAAVVRTVRGLLEQERPPSVGIACMNVKQRDLILEALDEAAAEDAQFAERLDAARNRRGSGTFEGLFVKNLENVQGDERDHIVISTTYGPDPKGKFYRRFGPLGLADGWRRMNVLVTRARVAIHLLTSIPPEAYRALEPVPEGAKPNGAWCLFAYLKFAEELAAEYAAEQTTASGGTPRGLLAELPSAQPSAVARALAKRLAPRNVASTLHWGNEGFCVDLALAPANTPERAAIGVLCDGTRFTGGGHPVDWDAFRCGVLERQGWVLRRVWSPHLSRDVAGWVEALAGAVKP